MSMDSLSSELEVDPEKENNYWDGTIVFEDRVKVYSKCDELEKFHTSADISANAGIIIMEKRLGVVPEKVWNNYCST